MEHTLIVAKQAGDVPIQNGFQPADNNRISSISALDCDRRMSYNPIKQWAPRGYASTYRYHFYLARINSPTIPPVLGVSGSILTPAPA